MWDREALKLETSHGAGDESKHKCLKRETGYKIICRD